MLKGYQAIDQSVREILPSQVRGVTLAGLTATEEEERREERGEGEERGGEGRGRGARASLSAGVAGGPEIEYAAS